MWKRILMLPLGHRWRTGISWGACGPQGTAPDWQGLSCCPMHGKHSINSSMLKIYFKLLLLWDNLKNSKPLWNIKTKSEAHADFISTRSQVWGCGCLCHASPSHTQEDTKEHNLNFILLSAITAQCASRSKCICQNLFFLCSNGMRFESLGQSPALVSHSTVQCAFVFLVSQANLYLKSIFRCILWSPSSTKFNIKEELL